MPGNWALTFTVDACEDRNSGFEFLEGLRFFREELLMVEATLKEMLSVLIRARGHEIVADGPASMNGSDLGMNPHELVEAALAACTAMTVQLYAQRKQWKLQTVNVKAQIISEGPETLIREDLNVVGDLSEQQLHRLFDIACRCPIHRLLKSHVTIDTNYLGPQKELLWTHR